MSLIYFITHPEVQVDPKVPVPQWPLSGKGIDRIRLLITKNWVQKIRAIYSSSERKAIDCAKILGDHLYLPFTQKRNSEKTIVHRQAIYRRKPSKPWLQDSLTIQLHPSRAGSAQSMHNHVSSKR